MTVTAGPSHVPPTVPGSWWLGSTRDILRNSLDLGLRAYEECGDVVRVVVGPPGRRHEFFTINHPDGVGLLLSAPNNRNFRKDSVFYQAVRDVYGDGLLTSQDEKWLRQRRMIQPLFTPKNVDGYAQAIRTEVEHVAGTLPGNEGQVLDLRAWMGELTLGVASKILFGEQSPQMTGVLRAAFPVLGRAYLRRGLAPVKIPLTWPTPANRRTACAEKQIRAVCDELVEHRRSLPDPGTDLVGRLISARDDNDRLSVDEIRDQIKVFLLAGHETTATALTFALHLLGHSPDVQKRVREEAESVLDTDGGSAAEARALAYTTMVLEEATRLYPPAPYLTRNGIEASDICGFRIPAGADVNVATWVIHHRADLWPDPFRFDPERFAPGRESERHRFAWVPFGHGPRGCIGQRFAMLEAVIALAVLVRAYEFLSPEGDVPVNADIVLHPVGTVPCLVRQRSSVPPATRSRTLFQA